MMAAGASATNGVILRSINGGTVWSYAALPQVPLNLVTPAALGAPGAFNYVASDASGRHVFAVGTPSLAIGSNPLLGYTTGTGGAFPNPVLPSVAIASATSIGIPVIMYSGNSGVSWVYQVAPTIPGAFYELNQVAVLKGTVAFAVGGNPFGTDGTPALNTNVVASSGTIIATTNGGFSWVMQTLAGFTYTCPTAETSGTYSNTITAATLASGQITVKPAAVLANYSWCATSVPAAYTPAATQAANTIPYITGVAFTQTAGVYKGWAVGNRGAVYTTTFTPSSVSPFQTATSWAFYSAPAAFVNAVQLSSGWVNLYGIVWDNSNVGYIYGVNLILSTHNGGTNWMVETPNSMIVGTTPTNIWGIATVPTTY